MSADASAVRKPRADAERNRERLLEAAKGGFAEVGSDVSLEEIARRAGVGIGTLYRHFPTREAVVEAVYRREVQQLSDSAARLLEQVPPARALHDWLLLLIDYMAAKKVIVAALSPTGAGASALYATSGTTIKDTLALLVERAAASGDIRPDIDTNDMVRLIAGFGYDASGPGWQASARRMVDVVMDGLKAHRAG